MPFDENDWDSTNKKNVSVASTKQEQNRVQDETNENQTIEVLPTGVHLTAERMGFRKGNDWISYFAADGSFQFKGNNNNKIAWDGTALSIMGVMHSANFNGNLVGDIGNPTAGFRLSSLAAGTADDPTVFGAYVKGGTIDGSEIKGQVFDIGTDLILRAGTNNTTNALWSGIFTEGFNGTSNFENERAFAIEVYTENANTVGATGIRLANNSGSKIIYNQTDLTKNTFEYSADNTSIKITIRIGFFTGDISQGFDLTEANTTFTEIANHAETISKGQTINPFKVAGIEFRQIPVLQTPADPTTHFNLVMEPYHELELGNASPEGKLIILVKGEATTGNIDARSYNLKGNGIISNI